jgi:hypothetical protein
MARLADKTCETAKPLPGRELLLRDGDGLNPRIRPNGTKTWVIEYEFKGRRRKATIGVYDRVRAPGESITAWLEHARLTLAQARSIAAAWKAERRAERDPVAEWEAKLASKQAEVEAAQQAEKVESERPTVREAIKLFMAKHINGKKSASDTQYRLDRLAKILGDRKICDVTPVRK